MTLRVVFMGTPDFAVPALRALIDGPHDVVAVYSQPPRPKGRGQAVQKSPVHELAETRGIAVFTPKSLKKDEAAQKEFADHKADVAIVAAYGLILPKAVLDAPRYGCLNIHASLLPRWRGASPIQRAVWAGDKESGVSIMQMDEGLDTGAVVSMTSIPLDETTTSSALHDALSALGGKMIADALVQLAQTGKLPSTPQPDTGVTYAGLLTKDDGRVDWAQDAPSILRQIRALNPWPGVWTMLPDGRRLKILAAEKTNDGANAAPGTILDRTGLIACGGGTALRLATVQPENAKPMTAAAAANGGYLRADTILV